MKRKTTLIAISIVFSGIFYASLNNNAFTNPDGAPIRTSGSPVDGNGTCANSGCHTSFQVITKNNLITSNIPTEGYTPGTTYTIFAKTNSAPNRVRFGFQISPQNSTGALSGTMIITNAPETKLLGSGKYITHTSNGTTGNNGVKEWSFNWTAPTAGSGTVTFYGCFNNANNNGGTTGDSIIKSTLVVQEKLAASIGLNAFQKHGFNMYPMPANTEINIANNHRVYVSSIQIFDLTGKLMMSKEMESDENMKVDVAALSKGNYIIHLSSEQGSIATAKFIKE